MRAALRVREARHGSVHGPGPEGLNVWADGGWWTFAPRAGPLAALGGGGWRPAPGLPVIVLGEVRDGGWGFLDDGRPRLPAAPLARLLAGAGA